MVELLLLVFGGIGSVVLMGIGARKSVKLVLYFMFIMLCLRILFILYH